MADHYVIPFEIEEHEMTPKLIVAGWVSLDTLTFPNTRYHSPGGGALYAALASARYTPTGIVALEGDDFPSSLLDELEMRGVSTSGIRRVHGVSTSFEVRYDAEYEAHYGRVEQGVGVYLDPRHFPTDYKGAEYIFVAPMHPNLQQNWIPLGKQLGMRLVLGTNLIHTQNPDLRDQVLSMLKEVDLFFCNSYEARHLTGRRDPAEAARGIGDMVQIGIITLNKDGVIVVNNNIVVHYPSLPAVVKDPSGAGDVFAGAFLGHFIEHKDIDLACKVALKDASDAVATLGIAAYIPHAVKITSLRTFPRIK